MPSDRDIREDGALVDVDRFIDEATQVRVDLIRALRGDDPLALSREQSAFDQLTYVGYKWLRQGGLISVLVVGWHLNPGSTSRVEAAVEPGFHDAALLVGVPDVPDADVVLGELSAVPAHLADDGVVVIHVRTHSDGYTLTGPQPFLRDRMLLRVVPLHARIDDCSDLSDLRFRGACIDASQRSAQQKVVSRNPFAGMDDDFRAVRGKELGSAEINGLLSGPPQEGRRDEQAEREPREPISVARDRFLRCFLPLSGGGGVAAIMCGLTLRGSFGLPIGACGVVLLLSGPAIGIWWGVM